jgi:peptidoglycan/LPS O-acetylase OafA/YrhL
LAVILVLLAHAEIPGFSGGFVGVDVFFVVSGFVITGQLLRQPAAPVRTRLVEFYTRRVKRIVPAATVALLATFALSYYWLGVPAAQSLAVDERWASLFGANWRFAATGTNYFTAHQGSSLILNFWSLSVEEQFYLFFPLLLVLLMSLVATRNRRRALVGVCLVLVCASAWWCAYQTRVDPVGAYYSPFTRFWELGLGALLALVPRPQWIPDVVRAAITWVSLAAIVASALLLSDNGSYPGVAAWWPAGAAGALLVFGGLGGRHGAERLLELRSMRFTGNISYSLYLWHYPILMLAMTYATGGVLPLSARFELLALSYLVAIASYYYVENPIRRLRLPGRRKVAGLVMAPAMAASVWAVTGLALGLTTAGPTTTASSAVTPGSATAVARAVAEAAAVRTIPEDSLPRQATFDSAQASYAASGPAFFSACDPYLHPGLAGHPVPCLLGDLHAKRTVVLVGDSTVGNWAPALDGGLKKRGYRLAVFGYAGCPAPDIIYSAETAAQYGNCNLWHLRVGRAIAALHPEAVIAVSGATDLGLVSNSAWSAGYARLFAVATEKDPSAVRVIMGTSPEFAESVPACLAAHHDPQQCSSRYTYGAGYYGAYLSRDREEAAAARARLVPTHQWFCDGDVCEPVIGRYVAFADVEHLTIDYSEYLSSVVTARVLASLGT